MFPRGEIVDEEIESWQISLQIQNNDIIEQCRFYVFFTGKYNYRFFKINKKNNIALLPTSKEIIKK